MDLCVLDLEIGGGGDHGGVVGAELGWGDMDWDFGLAESCLEFGAEDAIGGDATGEHDGFGVGEIGGLLHFAHESISGGLLEIISDLDFLVFGEFFGEFV